ncbi:MAG: hypothetical protein AB1716_15580, partial [Planctomycetota bacterium]
GDFVAARFARSIARIITGIEHGSAAAALIDTLLSSFGERPLLFRDDEHFFAGELARAKGDLPRALSEYQQCIDLARDPWPANWARARLARLAPPAQGTTSRPVARLPGAVAS